MHRWLQFGFKQITVVLLVLFALLSDGCRFKQNDFLTPQERDWLTKNGSKIVVAPDPRWNVDKQVEQQQIYKGLTADYMKLVEKKLGVRFLRLYTENWSQVLAAEKRGEIDIHPVLARSKERQRDWLFTEPYLQIPMIVVTRASLKKNFSPSKMRTMRMGVGHGFGIDEFVKENCRDYNIVPVESDRFGLIEVSLGEIDLMITDLASASYYIEREGLTNLRLVATMGSLYEFCFASRRDKPLLTSILNKALKQIAREERNTVYNRWIVFDTRPFYKNRIFWYSVIFAMFMVMVVITAILFWNSMLKAEVKVKTQELRRANEQLEERVEERTEQLSEINKLLQQKIEERAVMARDLLHISGSERARIGRELHDSIGQEMVAITFLCRALEERLRAVDPQAADGLIKISNHIEDVIAGMKRIVRGLLPVDIMDRGLIVALRQMAREIESTYEIQCSFECDCEDKFKISCNALATNIYRIAQEAVSNAVKHAAPKKISISLHVLDGKGLLKVKDDGKGIDRGDSHAGMGLGIMRYRAELARGSLEISSGAGKGTLIICYFDPVSDIEMS
jgi:signal transduction histidine kinase